MPIIRAKIRLSIFRSIVFLEKRNHIPIIPNIIKTDTKMYDVLRDVVMCSDTESVNASDVVKKGFTAFKYLKDGTLRYPELKTATPDTMKPIITPILLRIIVFPELNFLIISHITTKIVGKIITNDNAFKPVDPIKDAEVLSNINEKIVKLVANIGIAQIKKVSFFLKNGTAKKYTAIATRKNKIPPQDEKPNAKNNPAKINLINENFPLLCIIPETKRYIARNAKNNPNGSDLNQPISPRVNIGTEIENINAANSPAVVPPRTRTNAKTEIAVNEPITSGKIITKSYNDELEPNN